MRCKCGGKLWKLGIERVPELWKCEDCEREWVIDFSLRPLIAKYDYYRGR